MYVDQWLINKQIHIMANFGFLHTEVVKEFLRKFHFSFYDILAHKITEMKKGSEEVNVSYADPDNQSCMNLF